jgi:F-type H+-transporting ATPase subunit a
MGFDLQEYILHHIRNSDQWHLPLFPPIKLPWFLSLHELVMLFVAVVLVIVFCRLYRKDQEVPTGFTNLLEAFIVFIRDDIVVPALGKEDGRRMTPLFCTFFFFILGLNLIGLTPIFPTATANVNVTGGLALVTLTFMIAGAVYRNGPKGFLKALTPSGVPFPILLILVPIEFLGLFIRSFALMIRLFANMMAGHIVILSILGLVVAFGLVALPAVILALGISLLELFVAFLQAYIFTLLSAIFIGQVYHPEH